MKRTFSFLILLVLLVMSSTQVMAQGGFVSNPTPVPVLDTDGDGLPDTRDKCPTVAGPLENGGCPQTFPPPVNPPPVDPPAGVPPSNPPVNPGTGDPSANPPAEAVEVTLPPFVPPALPTDGCYVTGRSSDRVNVRIRPSMDAPVIGQLLPGVIYQANGYVVNGAEVWMQLTSFDGSGATGYSAQSVLMATANCGPLESIDDLVSAEGDDVQSLECVTKPGTTLVESCWCPTSDTACVEVLTSICYGNGSYIEAGPDMTACWYEPSNSASQIGPCLGEGADHGVTVLAWARVDGPPPSDDDVVVDGRIITAENFAVGCDDVENARLGGWGSSMYQYAYNDPAVACEDDLTVWWVDLPNPNDPFDMYTPVPGTCVGDLDQLPSEPRPAGSSRLLARLPRPGSENLTTGASAEDCDANDVLDAFQTPMPACTAPRNSDKEHAGWWAQVLDLTCPGGWIMATEIDSEGDEVVTDAVCDD